MNENFHVNPSDLVSKDISVINEKKEKSGLNLLNPIDDIQNEVKKRLSAV